MRIELNLLSQKLLYPKTTLPSELALPSYILFILKSTLEGSSVINLL